MHGKTLILIPAYNEAERIGRVLSGIEKHQPTAEVMVIDDGSADNTGAVAQELGARVLRHPFNLGYGSALHTGYLYARRHGYLRVVQMDADCQHDPESLKVLLASLEDGADVVVGSRFLYPEQPRSSLPRRIGSKLFAWIVTFWTGKRITDPTSGFQAFSSRALDELVPDSFPEDYPDADVLIRLARAGLKLEEVPVRMHPRPSGVSMHRGGKSAYYLYKMFLSLALLRFRRRTVFRPRDKMVQAS